jgi:hypothetical protein
MKREVGRIWKGLGEMEGKGIKKLQILLSYTLSKVIYKHYYVDSRNDKIPSSTAFLVYLETHWNALSTASCAELATNHCTSDSRMRLPRASSSTHPPVPSTRITGF